MTCQLDNHPAATEIAGWLRQGLSATAVNQQLRMLDPKHKDVAPAVFSRHRTGCLGMVKLAKGRGPAADITPLDVADIEDEDVSADVIKSLALRTFYARLKRNPADVGMKELVSVIAALTRSGAAGKQGKGAVEEAMANVDG